MADEIKNNSAAEMDWDSGIAADVGGGEFNLPPVGEYGFTVHTFEKTMSKSGRKMAHIVIELDENGQFWKIDDYLVLQDNMAWKIATFFESLGLKEKGEPLVRMPWDEIIAKTGRVKIKHETYEGKEYCKVDRYLLTDAAKAPTAPANDMPFEI